MNVYDIFIKTEALHFLNWQLLFQLVKPWEKFPAHCHHFCSFFINHAVPNVNDGLFSCAKYQCVPVKDNVLGIMGLQSRKVYHLLIEHKKEIMPLNNLWPVEVIQKDTLSIFCTKPRAASGITKSIENRCYRVKSKSLDRICRLIKHCFWIWYVLYAKGSIIKPVNISLFIQFFWSSGIAQDSHCLSRPVTHSPILAIWRISMCDFFDLSSFSCAVLISHAVDEFLQLGTDLYLQWTWQWVLSYYFVPFRWRQAFFPFLSAPFPLAFMPPLVLVSVIAVCFTAWISAW